MRQAAAALTAAPEQLDHLDPPLGFGEWLERPAGAVAAATADRWAEVHQLVNRVLDRGLAGDKVRRAAHVTNGSGKTTA